MNCLTKLFQQKRRRIGYIQAFSGPMISKRDSSEENLKMLEDDDLAKPLLVAKEYIEERYGTY